MATLGLNIDHVATLRQARGGAEPDPIAAAAIAEFAGADAITVHLREDRRHIQDRDLRLLKDTIKTRINLEMAPTEEMQKIALEIKPYSVTLVPKKDKSLPEGGLDVKGQQERLTEYLKPFIENNIIVSMFIDADLDQVDASLETGAQFVEIHTGQYAEAFNTIEEEVAFKNLEVAVKHATEIGLKVNAGHGLNYNNVKRVLSIKKIEEFNIGHSIISRAVFVGLDRAVRDMKNILDNA